MSRRHGGVTKLTATADAEGTVSCPTPTCAGNNERVGDIGGTSITPQVEVDTVPNKDCLPCPETPGGPEWHSILVQPEDGVLRKHDGDSPFLILF